MGIQSWHKISACTAKNTQKAKEQRLYCYLFYYLTITMRPSKTCYTPKKLYTLLLAKVRSIFSVWTIKPLNNMFSSTPIDFMKLIAISSLSMLPQIAGNEFSLISSRICVSTAGLILSCKCQSWNYETLSPKWHLSEWKMFYFRENVSNFILFVSNC